MKIMICLFFVQYEQEQKRRKSRAQEVSENLVSIALTVVKTKTAAVHYETLIASHHFTGADVGEFGHGRKQFTGILHCADVWINLQTAEFLRKPLPSTRLPPHFYVTSDKSTPHRVTNQAIMLCPMIDGKREAIAVSAPDVYHETETGKKGDVSGGESEELAKSLYNEIHKAYPSIPEGDIKAAWVGTVCDGAYQTAGFKSTLASTLEQDESHELFNVLWDAPHFLDLAFCDVFNGKTGHSKDFIKTLVDRSSVVHRLFQRGKMLSHAVELSKKDDELVLRLTSRPCSTRFSTSQYVEFRKLLDSLPLFIKAFREFKFSEVKEFQIAGQDFLMDLCGCCDVLKPYMEMFVALQGLSVPCWKVVVWWRKVKDYVEEVEKEFSLATTTKRLPLLDKHLTNIKAGHFKGTKLIPGWLVTSSERRVVDNEVETVDHWRVRDVCDVESDLKNFMGDLKFSFESRVDSSSVEMLRILTCVDLDSLFALLCGERLESGKVKLAVGEGQLERYGRDNFQKLFEYVCSLEHVQALATDFCDENFDELLFDPAFGNKVHHKMKQALKRALWIEDGKYLQSWFGLPDGKSYGSLKKLRLAVDDDIFAVGNRYEITVQNSGEPFIAEINEMEVYRTIYTDENLFTAIGIEGCVAIDIALAKGGTEAVVESYYSVMNSQKQPGGQHNETLALR